MSAPYLDGSKSAYHWNKFRNYRNLVRKGIKKAKSDYYTKLIEESKGNSSKLWSAVKQVLPSKNVLEPINCIERDGVISTNPQSIASALNNFFMNIRKKLSELFTTSDLNVNHYMADVSSTFCFKEISQSFVRNQYTNFNANKAIGLDKVSIRLLKDSVEAVIPSFTSLFNKSIKESIFPSIWKNAKVTTIYKMGKRSDPSNYRPISVLPILSKILEEAPHQQLFEYLTQIKTLTERQSGFKPKSSTTEAVGQFTDSILIKMDNGLLSGVVFLDLTKAFDTVDHSILLRKLSRYGLCDAAMSWFESYLDNRLQATFCQHYLSDQARISVGVPQGSIWAITVFSLRKQPSKLS